MSDRLASEDLDDLIRPRTDDEMRDMGYVLAASYPGWDNGRQVLRQFWSLPLPNLTAPRGPIDYGTPRPSDG